MHTTIGINLNPIPFVVGAAVSRIFSNLSSCQIFEKRKFKGDSSSTVTAVYMCSYSSVFIRRVSRQKKLTDHFTQFILLTE